MFATTRDQRRQLARDNAKQSATLTEVSADAWPDRLPDGLEKVWRSRGFLVQQYAGCEGILCRLSISRTSVEVALNRWDAGITWDDIQRLKREAGYGQFDAVEVFPNDRDIVNVANMRHIWIAEELLPFAWRKERA